jgi:mannosyl-oligosaccharide alpha-1,2-mannosidase
LDALDTMWIMGMREEFKEAQDWLAKNIDFDRVKTSVRATTITCALPGWLTS